MLNRLGLKRGHKPPTARPQIRPAPKLTPSAASARSIARKVSSSTAESQTPKEFSRQQLYAILAEAVRNTG
jgi:GcrA cell cycle regulator